MHPTIAEGLFIGLMSGTSLDGIDCAIVNISEEHIHLVATYSLDWPQDLQLRLKALSESGDSLNEALILDQLTAQFFARTALECIQQAGLSAEQITAIGSHGQTVRHSPACIPGYSLQIGHPARIAEITGITTIGDFRSRDIAAGGQGAPLTPAFHDRLFNQDNRRRVIVNIGGIANITAFTPGQILGYDTGPGNRLLDDWIQYSQNQPFDRDGAFAASGNIHKPLLTSLLADSYFKKSAPKSTGSDYFNLAWLKKYLEQFPGLSPEDVQATLSSLTAKSIAAEILKISENCEEVLVCGGGAHNLDLMQKLQLALPSATVNSTAFHNISPDWIEAMAFAWLAYQTLNDQPGNLPEVTGAAGSRVCGAIYPA